MYKLNKNTIKKVVLISLLGEYSNVLYGSVRLQKVLYFIQKEQEVKPFTFKKHWYGQYSEEVDTQMKEIGDLKIAKVQLCENQLNVYKISKFETLEKARQILKAIYPDLFNSIVKNVEEYGYLQEEKLLGKAYGLAEMEKANEGDVLIEDNLPEYIEVDEIIAPEMLEDFELSLNPDFVNPLIKLVKGLEKIELSPKVEARLFSAR